MRKQDRIARERQQQRQSHPDEPMRKASPPDVGRREQISREQIKGSGQTPGRPPRVSGKLPLPD